MNSTSSATDVLQYPRVNSAAPPVRQARGRLRGPSSPDRDASSRTCGYHGGAASAAQGRAAREEVKRPLIRENLNVIQTSVLGG